MMVLNLSRTARCPVFFHVLFTPTTFLHHHVTSANTFGDPPKHCRQALLLSVDAPLVHKLGVRRRTACAKRPLHHGAS